jgi:hypothetical protein
MAAVGFARLCCGRMHYAQVMLAVRRCLHEPDNVPNRPFSVAITAPFRASHSCDFWLLALRLRFAAFRPIG